MKVIKKENTEDVYAFNPAKILKAKAFKQRPTLRWTLQTMKGTVGHRADACRRV